mgnify:CR=1 FL=1
MLCLDRLRDRLTAQAKIARERPEAWLEMRDIFGALADATRRGIVERLAAALREAEEREEAKMLTTTLPLRWGRENPAFRQFFGTRQHATIVDIETIAFHYGVYKFKTDPNVTPVALLPGMVVL